MILIAHILTSRGSRLQIVDTVVADTVVRSVLSSEMIIVNVWMRRLLEICLSLLWMLLIEPIQLSESWCDDHLPPHIIHHDHNYCSAISQLMLKYNHYWTLIITSFITSFQATSAEGRLYPRRFLRFKCKLRVILKLFCINL